MGAAKVFHAKKKQIQLNYGGKQNEIATLLFSLFSSFIELVSVGIELLEIYSRHEGANTNFMIDFGIDVYRFYCVVVWNLFTRFLSLHTAHHDKCNKLE